MMVPPISTRRTTTTSQLKS